MSNYIEYGDKVVFHPGYYIKEMVEESGLSQEDFAKRLGTTPKTLSKLVNGLQSLSIEIASKLSRMLGTTLDFWLNIQKAYDIGRAEYESAQELKQEREIFKLMDYGYFVENFGLPQMPRQVDAQIKAVREFLMVSSLTILAQPDLQASFRSYSSELSKANIVNANAMVQVAINQMAKIESPKFNRQKFVRAVEFALTKTCDHESFLPEIKAAFMEAGVILFTLPNLKGSGINGATKKVGSRLLLLVNDRRHYADTFWFTLFHEIGHIQHGDYGITFADNNDDVEDEADKYARETLIPQTAYADFVAAHGQNYDEQAIRDFAASIGRDPGIVYGRLQIDGRIPYIETRLAGKLRRKYDLKAG